MNTVTINADLGQQRISRHIYGHFAEHLGRCIYDGLWVGEDSHIPNTRGFRNDVVAALKKLNIKIGSEMGVIGFTNDPVSLIITPTLTTVAEPAFEIGKKSCELLLKHITKKNFVPQEVILPGKLIVRESTSRK